MWIRNDVTNQQISYKTTNVDKNSNLILPELSYTIVGAMFTVFNEMGGGLKEKYYYAPIQRLLESKGLHVQGQIRIPIEFRHSKVGDQFLDFLVDNKVVLEIKVGGRFRTSDYNQVKAYLRLIGCPLGILARFDQNGVAFHRILNPNNKQKYS